MRSLARLRLLKLVALVVLSLVAFVGVFPQASDRSPNLAVLPFIESGRAKYGASEATNRLNEELLKSGKFAMVDRSKIDAIETELLYKFRDQIDPENTRIIGEKIGAEILILGNLMEYTEKQKSSLSGMIHYENFIKFNLRAIRSSNAEVIFSKTFEKFGFSVGAPIGAMNEVAGKSLKDAAMELAKKISLSPEK